MHIKFKFLLLTVALLTLAVRTTLPVMAQNPNGSIRGTVTDQNGAVIQNATVIATNKATRDSRKVSTGGDGIYAIEDLLPGEYDVKIEAKGFATQNITGVTVQTGSTTSGDATLRTGQVGEVVDVVAEAPIIDKQNYKIDGVVTRQKIDALPLNGRNFLQLALLEPGVAVNVDSVGGSANNLFGVSVGGAPTALTRLTVDGGSILDPVTGGAAQNFSTETIQEFQISTFNFDLSTGVTSVGAVNIVSRTGTNAIHGNAFLFFRDHSLAALPTFFRPTRTFDPFFRRYQYGGSLGGPIKKDRAWFFGNFEKLRQRSIISNFITGAPVLALFNNTFESPYDGYLLNVRGDFKLTDKHNLFARFSRDSNQAFAPTTNNSMPSNWRHNVNRVNDAQGGLTTVLKQNVVNDVRFNYQRINNTSDPPGESQCPASDPRCIGARGAQISIVSSNFLIGNETNAPQNRILDRYQTRDDLTWQKGAHRIRFGGEWEHNYGVGSWDFFDPALMVLHNPATVEGVNALVAATFGGSPATAPLVPLLTIPLPAALKTGSGTVPTLNDILQLPFAGGVVGVGDKVQPPLFHQSIAKQSNRYRFYGQDSWLVKPGFTFSFGASYQYETNLANHDLTRPPLLSALVGDLGRAKKDKNNIAPSLGFAWDVKNDGKTVVRGGAGMYYDTVLFVTRLLERPLLGPAGDGRLSIPSAFFVNPFPFAPVPPLPGAAAVFNLINPAVGTSLSFTTIPTKFTGANLLSAIGVQVPALQGLLANGASKGFDSLQFIKTASLPATLLDPNLETPYSEQFTIGVQRQLPHNAALSVDFVRRNRVHTLTTFATVGSIALDANKFFRSPALGGPVIPKCTAAQAVDPTAICSNGPIQLFQTINRNNYTALLVKLDKRFTSRYQFTASYALSELKGFFLDEDSSCLFCNKGDLDEDARHRFTFSGLVNLPKGFQASLIATYASRPPFNARLSSKSITSGVDFNGDGTFGDTLPGLKINSLGRGTGKSDLFRLVNLYNAALFADPVKRAIFKPFALPPDFSFGDDFQSEDIRISKEIRFKERYAIQGIFEVFNIFNISNLGGYSRTLDAGTFDANGNVVPPSRFQFGQPSFRVGSGGFGTGAPRSIQLAARFTF